MAVIGIIGAMEEEVAALKEKMQISGVLKRASMEFYKGTLQGKPVVVVRSGIGKVNAGLCTQILVDLFDREIGPGEKMETHVREQLHRAFSVFIVHDGKMLIQQRALDKYHSAGLWANACCSHPRYGETFEESVQTRLEVELGIPTGTCQPKELFSFVYYSRYDGLSEYEYDHVLLVDYAGKIWENPEEVMDTRWISYEDLQNEMEKEPAKFSTWFMIAAPKVLKELNK